MTWLADAALNIHAAAVPEQQPCVSAQIELFVEWRAEVM
jgi:hypothetical protein